MGEAVTYADLSAFQVMAGLRYAFPKAAEAALQATPGLRQLDADVRSLPRIKAYLASKRRIPCLRASSAG